MSDDINFTIGDTDAQNKFRKLYHSFILSLPTLTITIEKAFNRKPENINLVDALIFDLSSECVDRFSEIGLLCANGLGNGALIILRSMFEYLVTARYLHLRPEKAEDFKNYMFVQEHTVRNQIEKTFGKDFIKDDYREFIDNYFNQVKERYSRHAKDGRTSTKTRWSDVGVVDMAIETGLGKFVILAYYIPIEKAHPHFLNLMTRKDQIDEVVSQTLFVSHKMLIELFILQQEHFKLSELKPLISQSIKDFDEVWKDYINQ